MTFFNSKVYSFSDLVTILSKLLWFNTVSARGAVDPVLVVEAVETVEVVGPVLVVLVVEAVETGGAVGTVEAGDGGDGSTL